jgi:8-oxo-dGTP diphosphatase
MNHSFNIRVYGIFINEAREVLVADEKISGIEFTKFPGGGLEFGEGTIECLERECIEELGQEFRVLEHFYTTDYFQLSAFNKSHQLISIYYFIEPIGTLQAKLSEKPFDFQENDKEHLSFRMVSLKELKESQFKWPVDKLVIKKLHNKFSNDD